MSEQTADHQGKSYSELHRPASEFDSRSDYLDHELQIMEAKPWTLNLPGKDFRFEVEDLVPAIAATIGLIVMLSAVSATWAGVLSDTHDHINLGREWVVELIRIEMIVPSLLFVIIGSGLLNPRANLPGTHGPMIPLIGAIAMAGAHPLALAILMGVFGAILVYFKGGSRLVNMTGEGVAGGLLVYLGALGTFKQTEAMLKWAEGLQAAHELDYSLGYVGLLILVVNLLLYAYLARIGKRWLAIPLCSAAALVCGLVGGAAMDLSFDVGVGFPNLNPVYWWGSTETGWMLGMPDLSAFIASVPFAILAVAMWSPDFLGHRIFQELSYPKGSERVLMDVDATMAICSVRQVVGTVIGGANMTSSWGTFMIPSAIAKRPIPAGAIVTGVMCIVVGIIGYPMNIAVWRPVLGIALLVGVYIPLLEAGMQMVRDAKDSQSAGICIFGSVIVNPVFAWALTMLLDNNGLIGDKERPSKLSVADRLIIPGAAFAICFIAMLAVGMLPGIPALL